MAWKSPDSHHTISHGQRSPVYVHPLHQSQHQCLSFLAMLCFTESLVRRKEGKKWKISQEWKTTWMSWLMWITGACNSLACKYIVRLVTNDCGVHVCLIWFVRFEKWIFEDLWNVTCETSGGETLKREPHLDMVMNDLKKENVMYSVNVKDRRCGFFILHQRNKSDNKQIMRERTANIGSQKSYQLIYLWLRPDEFVIFGVIGLDTWVWIKMNFSFCYLSKNKNIQISTTTKHSSSSSNTITKKCENVSELTKIVRSTKFCEEDERSSA